MPAPQPILDLVARFHEHHDAYKSGVYNETQLRRDFLDPFFRELGWDVDNTAGYAESYRDVIHEDQVKIGGAVKAPDYGFRIGGQRKFFLETKLLDAVSRPRPLFPAPFILQPSSFILSSLSRHLSATDSALDREVYSLYQLRDDEIHLVEQQA